MNRKSWTIVLMLACITGLVWGAGSEEAADVGPDGDMKWSGTIRVAPYMQGPIENDIITPKLEEALLEYGYDVDLENEYIESTGYHDVVSLRIASGEAPDIFYPGTINRTYAWYEQGAIAEWDEEFFVENAPALAKYWNESSHLASKYRDLIWNMAARDGKMICVPAIGADFGPTLNAMYNKGWLDELGVSDLPLEIDDWYELMVRFAEEDPDGNGRDDTYGFSRTGADIVFGAFGSFPGFGDFDYGHFYLRDGKMVSANLWPGNKEALQLLNRAFEKGVLDPEFVTGENTGGYWAISHAFINGKIGFSARSNIYHWWKPEERKGNPGRVRKEFEAVQGPDADIEWAPYPKGPQGYFGYFSRTPVTMQQGVVYNADLNDEMDKLAAIFQITSIFSEDYDLALLASYGIEGEHFQYMQNEDGSQYVSSVISTPEKNALGIAAMRDLYGPSRPHNEKLQTLAVNTPTSKIRRSIVDGKQMSGGYVSDIYVALPSESLYNDELKTYRDTTWMKMIIGDLPIDYWDTFVEEYNKIGGAILTEEANDWYQSTK